MTTTTISTEILTGYTVPIAAPRLAELIAVYSQAHGLRKLVKFGATKAEIVALVERDIITPNNLLDVGIDPKTSTSEKVGVIIGILYLTPSNSSGFWNSCPMAALGCILSCLNTAGQGGIGINPETGLNVPQAARLVRHAFFMLKRPAFLAMLSKEIEALERKAERKNMTAAVRLNGVSDITWENIKTPTAPNLMSQFQNVIWYDYTKLPPSMRPKIASIPNYSVTFSRSGENDAHVLEALQADWNVAVVVDIPAHRKDIPVPATMEFGGVSYPTIDGDVLNSDARFKDAPNSIVVLRIKDASGTDAQRAGFGAAGNKAARNAQDSELGFVMTGFYNN